MANEGPWPYPPPDWVADAVFYEIFPERFANGNVKNDPPECLPWGDKPDRETFFGGDLQGILDHLDYLEDLGVTALYLTPVFYAGSNHKYDTYDYLRVDPAFGDERLLKRLANELHRRSMRLILDGVFNHAGVGFWAFRDVMERGPASPFKDWFFVDSFPIVESPPNYQTCGGTWYLPKLNTANSEVREYLLHVATYWIQTCEIDGWRLDVPWKVPLDFWRRFREAVKARKREAFLVGEIWRNAEPWLKGDTFDATMNYELRNAILDYLVLDHMDAEDFDYELASLRGRQGAAASFQLNLLGSHDTPRLLTLCAEDKARAELAITFQMTYTGAPMVYYGDEVGLAGGDDPDCRRCMPWDERDWDRELLETTRSLIHTRHAHPALRRGTFEPLMTFNGVYVYRRALGRDEAIVVLNPREARSGLRIPLGPSTSAVEYREEKTGRIYHAESGFLRLDHIPSKSSLLLFAER